MSPSTAVAESNAQQTRVEHVSVEHEPAGQLMRAVTQSRYGNAEVTAVDQIDRPTISSTEVLIEVVAAGLDRGVVHLMTGMPYLIRVMGFGFRRPKSPVLGLDVSGRVAAIGDAVTRFAIGDEVMGIAKGSFAEFAAADEAKLVHKPTNVSFAEAAVSTISGITALQALTKEGNVAAGERVLVIGASGGVGSFAVQIAVACGAEVTGVASGSKAELVRDLGATTVIDYTTTNLADVDEQFDLIIDIGGRNNISTLRKLLTTDGRLVMVGGEDGGPLTGGIGRQLRAAMLSPFVSQTLGFFLSEESLEFIEPVADLLASGEVVPSVGSSFRLADASNAIASMEAGLVRGKVVVEVSS